MPEPEPSRTYAILKLIWRRFVPQFAKPVLRKVLLPLFARQNTAGGAERRLVPVDPAPTTKPQTVPLQGGAVNRQIQYRIDAVSWYHEFDFGDGLVAKSKSTDIEDHRRFWAHIRSALDTVNFAGKTVLDIGCWDGYWSFYAEQRGAAHVLAIDDCEQNWAGDAGVRLAKELFHSSIEINTKLSVYELTSLQRKFDVILCLGVYYHLIDPFYAFAQIRHCCHDNSVVVFEGDVRSNVGLLPEVALHYFTIRDGAVARFRPTPAVLASFLEAAYLRVETETFLLPWNLQAPSAENQTLYNRTVLICRPFRGENRCFWYRPPFELGQYDTRWERVHEPN